ncbi:uncharacterized protein LOC129888402 isoform X2 [Solanum dulcamara]|uniref:uncharacterized protein LOC129888402 isoform X2 n=1 Tax=Solanum dulcamara TaxID=45834 RepID=UPI002486C96A|nr:uncharacterized protein LOC129888402 isoform X2 [Solanum dulcamara]
MNKFAYRQNALVGFGEIAVSKGIVCPKPRRSGLFNSASVQVNETFTTNAPLLQINQEVGGCDLKAGTELLDMILTKGGRYDVEYSNFQLDSSPPYFCGSPPSRASNPLIQDVNFCNDNFVPITPIPESAAPFSSSSRGCVRLKFGNNSAPVRIEGFNCRGSCSIPAVA